MQNLKSKYEQKEMRVSDSLWDRLEEKLDQVPAKEEKPKIFWLRYAVVILLMIGLGGSFWMINNKSNINENQEFANHLNKEKTETSQTNQNSQIEKLIPETESSGSNKEEKLVVENMTPSTSLITRELIKKENQTSNQTSEKESLIKKEEISIPKPEEKLAQNDASTSLNTQKPKERPKYITSSDLLFGVEIDKAKSERPKSAMGINISKPKNDSDFPNPKRIKLFGITLYNKDSVTTR